MFRFSHITISTKRHTEVIEMLTVVVNTYALKRYTKTAFFNIHLPSCGTNVMRVCGVSACCFQTTAEKNKCLLYWHLDGDPNQNRDAFIENRKAFMQTCLFLDQSRFIVGDRGFKGCLA